MLLTANNIPEGIMSLLEQVRQLNLTAHAGKAHYELADFLTEQGFFVECEHTIYSPDGKRERIDIMAHRDGVILAIEIDAHFKRKSVSRLKKVKVENVFLIICLLQETKMSIPEDIHAIVVPGSGKR